MKNADKAKLIQYQKMDRAQDFLNSIEGGSTINNNSVEIVRIKDALEFLRSLKAMNEFQLIASEKATDHAIDFLSKQEVYIKECVLEAEKKRELLATQLQNAKQTAQIEYETIIKPSFENIIASLQKVRALPLPTTHKSDSFYAIKPDIEIMYRKITDLTGQTYTR